MTDMLLLRQATQGSVRVGNVPDMCFLVITYHLFFPTCSLAKISPMATAFPSRRNVQKLLDSLPKVLSHESRISDSLRNGKQSRGMFLVGALLNMESDKQHFRHILLFYYRKGKNAVQVSKKVTDVYGEGMLTVRQCQNWFAKFRSGNFDVKDAPRSGKPVEADKDAIKALVDASLRITNT
ncbi:histone-lysine N-methyltransferase SETMAR [Trichonephila clavipes]|nr:histone-lysine N-methyltransferase SETMAR [Trichonephila clavipes]